MRKFLDILIENNKDLSSLLTEQAKEKKVTAETSAGKIYQLAELGFLNKDNKDFILVDNGVKIYVPKKLREPLKAEDKSQIELKQKSFKDKYSKYNTKNIFDVKEAKEVSDEIKTIGEPHIKIETFVSDDALKNRIREAYQERLHAMPLIIWGPPGSAKTSIIESYAKENDISCIVLVMSTQNVISFSGLPMISDEGKRSISMVPSWVPTDKPYDVKNIQGLEKSDIPVADAQLYYDPDGGIIFLDELTTTPHGLMSATRRLILDKYVGQHKIPDQWCLIGAANREVDRKDYIALQAAMENAVDQIEFIIDPEHSFWIKSARNEDVENSAKNMLPIVYEYLIKNKDKLFQRQVVQARRIDPELQDPAFATMRSWTNASKGLESKILYLEKKNPSSIIPKSKIFTQDGKSMIPLKDMTQEVQDKIDYIISKGNNYKDGYDNYIKRAISSAVGESAAEHFMKWKRTYQSDLEKKEDEERYMPSKKRPRR